MPQYDPPMLSKMSRTSTLKSKSFEPKKIKKRVTPKDEIEKEFATMPFERTLTREIKA
jgi:hypothetical protein